MRRAPAVILKHLQSGFLERFTEDHILALKFRRALTDVMHAREETNPDSALGRVKLEIRFDPAANRRRDIAIPKLSCDRGDVYQMTDQRVVRRAIKGRPFRIGLGLTPYPIWQGNHSACQGTVGFREPISIGHSVPHN